MYLYVCMYVYVWMYVCMYAGICMCMHVSMGVCMFVLNVQFAAQQAVIVPGVDCCLVHGLLMSRGSS